MLLDLRENICHTVKAPANVSWDIGKHATDVAYKAVSSLEGAGVFAVELFLTEEILLNETAHRPHNSGHHTIKSCYTSQFEQHLWAVVGLPLGEPSMKTPAPVMYNILGEDEFVEVATRIRYKSVLELDDFVYHWVSLVYFRALSIPGATVHWYDKPVTPRVGIIMGSDSGLPVMKDAARILNMFVSAHRTPEMMFSYASSALERHSDYHCWSLTPVPVIGVPVRASALDGLDSLLPIVQMPRGVPVATVAINNATNAGLRAVRMMGIRDADLLARMSQYQEDTRNDVLRNAEKLKKDGWVSYLNP
uniref:phosphoribosylaminoimidazole carboxylase n=1 Tax=Quercus lobata TaxID=97700 RepID=A0A7N2L5Q3_QUELO